eukprot:6195199-Pleurochrysis_carterae.AAC.1
MSPSSHTPYSLFEIAHGDVCRKRVHNNLAAMCKVRLSLCSGYGKQATSTQRNRFHASGQKA